MSNDESTALPDEVQDEISALEPASWLVLWSLRYWAVCYRQEKAAGPMLNDLFSRNQIADAVYPLNGLMQISAMTTKRSLDVRCPCCPKISADEHLMLRAVRESQRGDVEAVRTILRDWLPESAARMASHMVSGLAEILAGAGFRLKPLVSTSMPPSAVAPAATEDVAVGRLN